MKVGNLVEVYGDPIEGEIHIAEGHLGIIREINGLLLKVEFPGEQILLYSVFDVRVLDYEPC